MHLSGGTAPFHRGGCLMKMDSSTPLQVLGISTSPRLEGNSDLLLQSVLQGAERNGAIIQHLWVGQARFGLCTECNFCYSTGSCKISDDFQPTMAKILAADRLVFATPVFFAGVCAQAKTLIDRCQAYWVRRYRLDKSPPRTENTHIASLVAVGSDPEPGHFACLQKTARIFFRALGFGPAPDLYVGKVVKRGDIANHTKALSQAQALGQALVFHDPIRLRDAPDLYL